MADAVTIAVCGKGGVGKTSFSAMMLKLLAQGGGRRILAIDADPAVGLATALGIPVQKTVDDIRKNLIDQIRDGRAKSESGATTDLDYEIFESLVEQDGITLLAIGRPEDEGCFCRVNGLLRDIIGDLAEKFDVVVIDGEAGVEQINRRVMKKADHLVLVSDTSLKALNVTETIAHVAKDNGAVEFDSIGLVLNRVRNSAEVDEIASRTSLDLYGWMPDDDRVREMDFRGEPLTSMPDSTPALRAISTILEKLTIV